MEVDRELLESCLELFEDMWQPCDEACECIIHPLREVLGEPDERLTPEEMRRVGA